MAKMDREENYVIFTHMHVNMHHNKNNNNYSNVIVLKDEESKTQTKQKNVCKLVSVLFAKARATVLYNMTSI